jgi:bis(5'-nucleosidyl)-tetraphosphatase
MKKEYTAGLIVYRNTEQGIRFLLLYHGGRYWNFPKGHIEEKKNVEAFWGAPEISDASRADIVESESYDGRETSREAAIRETFEEAGIRPDQMDIKKGFRAVQRFKFKKGHEQVTKIVVFYLAETKSSAIKISSEHEGYGWFLYKDARYILGMHKDMQRLLKRSYDVIRGIEGISEDLEEKMVPQRETMRREPVRHEPTRPHLSRSQMPRLNSPRPPVNHNRYNRYDSRNNPRNRPQDNTPRTNDHFGGVRPKRMY